MNALDRIGLVAGALFFTAIVIWRVAAVRHAQQWVDRAVGRTSPSPTRR